MINYRLLKCINKTVCISHLMFFQDDVLMHLTNYAITKHSSDFVRDEEKGHKRYNLVRLL